MRVGIRNLGFCKQTGCRVGASYLERTNNNVIFLQKYKTFFFSQTQMHCFAPGSSWIIIVFGSWIRIRIEVKGVPWTLKMEAWKVCRTVVADPYHLVEDQDPDPQWSENLDPDPQLVGKLLKKSKHLVSLDRDARLHLATGIHRLPPHSAFQHGPQAVRFLISVNH